MIMGSVLLNILELRKLVYIAHVGTIHSKGDAIYGNS